MSDRGRVKSLPRIVNSGPHPGKRAIKGCILKTTIGVQTGYPHVVLRGITKNVHRFVAIAFLGEPPFPKAQVNHKNGIKHDNRLTNLEWTTARANNLHSYKILGQRPSHLGTFGEDHGTSIAVIATNMKTGKKTRYGAAMDAVRAGFESSGISRACAGKIAYHYGHTWRYENEEEARTWRAPALRKRPKIGAQYES